MAGGGTAAFEGQFEVQTGDGGYAVQATLLGAWGVTVDDDGTILVADVSASTIRAISSDGGIDTIAGTTDAGFSGDGGLGVDAELSGPEGRRHRS